MNTHQIQERTFLYETEPDLPPVETRDDLLRLYHTISALREENRHLRDENRRLQGILAKPKRRRKADQAHQFTPR